MKQDEFNWNIYPNFYGNELNKIALNYTLVLTKDNYDIINNEITIRDGYLPLHSQHKLLYETILKLTPAEIHEIGCGRGNHMANIQLLSKSKIEVSGSDISDEQLSRLRNDHSHLSDRVKKINIITDNIDPCEFIYTQAVLMHLSDVNCEKAIFNICASAGKMIVLQENFHRRDYETILKKIHPLGWEFAKMERNHVTYVNQEDTASMLVIKKN